MCAYNWILKTNYMVTLRINITEEEVFKLNDATKHHSLMIKTSLKRTRNTIWQKHKTCENSPS